MFVLGFLLIQENTMTNNKVQKEMFIQFKLPRLLFTSIENQDRNSYRAGSETGTDAEAM